MYIYHNTLLQEEPDAPFTKPLGFGTFVNNTNDGAYNITAYNNIVDVSEASWARFWHFYIWLVLISGILTTIWFTIGGCFDLKHMFARLKDVQYDEDDDGTVKEHLGSGEQT